MDAHKLDVQQSPVESLDTITCKLSFGAVKKQ